MALQQGLSTAVLNGCNDPNNRPPVLEPALTDGPQADRSGGKQQQPGPRRPDGVVPGDAPLPADGVAYVQLGSREVVTTVTVAQVAANQNPLRV